MVVPLPFSKALFLYGAPLAVPRDGDAEEWRAKLEEILNALEEEANRMVEK